MLGLKSDIIYLIDNPNRWTFFLFRIHIFMKLIDNSTDEDRLKCYNLHLFSLQSLEFESLTKCIKFNFKFQKIIHVFERSFQF